MKARVIPSGTATRERYPAVEIRKLQRLPLPGLTVKELNFRNVPYDASKDA